MVFEASKIAGFSVEKRRVALHSMLAAAAMTLLKLAAGLLSGSLGVLVGRPGAHLLFRAGERPAGRRGPHLWARQV